MSPWSNIAGYGITRNKHLLEHLIVEINLISKGDRCYCIQTLSQLGNMTSANYGKNFAKHYHWITEDVIVMFCSGGGFLSVALWSSVKQGTQHFTDENKVSRKWSDSVHLLPFQLNENNTTTHQVLIVKIQN